MGKKDVRGNTTDGQTSRRKLVRIPVVEKAGGAVPQPDVSEARLMDVSLDQKAITTDTKQRAITKLTTNNDESRIGDWRSVASSMKIGSLSTPNRYCC